MNRAKVMVPDAPAWARKSGRKPGRPAGGVGVADEPICKGKRMHTVRGMFKRILVVMAGVACALGLALATTHWALAWSWFGHRDLDRSSDYVREVLQLVNENYVDAKESEYDKLTKSALHGMIESLDPHSEFMESNDYREMEEEMTGKFGGIGIQVEI